MSCKKRSWKEAGGGTLGDSSPSSCLDGVFLAALLVVGPPRGVCTETCGLGVFRCRGSIPPPPPCVLTVAVAVVTHADGAAQEAGCPAEVAGAGVGDVVVAADGLLGQHGDGAGRRAAHDAVGAVGLVGHAGVGARAHHVGAGLCGRGAGEEAVGEKADFGLVLSG